MSVVDSKRVLVVDDSPTQAKQLQLILLSAGFDVEVAQNSHRALEMLDAGPPFDMVMSDVLMPGLSGYELCQAIKAHPVHNDVPVILLTMLNDADDIMSGLASGADNFITKPYEPDDLLERINTVFANRRSGERKHGETTASKFHFLGRAYAVSSAREQILTFLTSTFEDYARGREREKKVLRADMENKRRTAEMLAQKNDELTSMNSRLGEANDRLAEAKRRLETSYDDLKKEQALREIELRRMEVELNTARTVQSMLIPDGPPQDVPGVEFAFSYRPAAETGGDWLGFIHDSERHEVSVLIGDVTGHGVASALLTAGVFSFISSLRHQQRSASLDLDQTLTALSRIVLDMGRGQYTMTFFAARLNYDTRVLHFVNAGHPHPIFFRASDLTDDIDKDARRRVRSLHSRGPRLGDHDKPEFQCREVTLEPGDLVLWFTDGVTENENPAGEMPGERRLCRWLREVYPLAIEEAKDVLEMRINEFIAGRAPSDDMAFVLARVL